MKKAREEKISDVSLASFQEKLCIDQTQGKVMMKWDPRPVKVIMCGNIYLTVVNILC